MTAQSSGRSSLAALILAGLLAAGTVQAQNSQLAFTLNNFSNGSNNAYYIGFEFSVTTMKTVNQLGILNTNSHTTLPGNTGVGIYSVTAGGTTPKAATAVVTAVVPAGTTPTGAGALGAFMVSVSPMFCWRKRAGPMRDMAPLRSPFKRVSAM